MTTTPKLSLPELRQIVWNQLGIRVGPQVTAEQMHELLAYTVQVSDLPLNEFNKMRDEITAYIEKHKDRLSLPCDGNCYAHADGVVLSCYKQLKQELGT